MEEKKTSTKEKKHLESIEKHNKKDVETLIKDNDLDTNHPGKDDQAAKVHLDTNHDNDIEEIDEISNPIVDLSEDQEDEIEDEVNNRFKFSPKTIAMALLSVIGALAIIFVVWGLVENHMANNELRSQAQVLIHNIQVNMASEEKEGAVENGDIVNINFVGTIDGVEFEGGTAENVPLEIGSNSFIPGFEEQLIGHNKGDSFDINVTFPEDYFATEFAGKDAVFHVTINNILLVPELNDAFVQSLQIPNISTVSQLTDYAMEYLRAFNAQQGQ